MDTVGVIVTAPGKDVDFVSRFFAPGAGIPEDPVTGSAHCNLIPYWAEKLGKNKLHAYQVSARKGELKGLEWGGLKPGTQLGPLAPIFPRADKGLTAIMIQMEQDKNTPISHANAAHDTATLTPNDFPEMSLASATFCGAPAYASV